VPSCGAPSSSLSVGRPHVPVMAGRRTSPVEKWGAAAGGVSCGGVASAEDADGGRVLRGECCRGRRNERRGCRCRMWSGRYRASRRAAAAPVRQREVPPSSFSLASHRSVSCHGWPVRRLMLGRRVAAAPWPPPCTAVAGVCHHRRPLSKSQRSARRRLRTVVVDVLVPLVAALGEETRC